jgi:hypothetical protein
MPDVVPPKAAAHASAPAPAGGAGDGKPGGIPAAWNPRSRGVPSRQLLALAGRGFTRFLERTAVPGTSDGTDDERS